MPPVPASRRSHTRNKSPPTLPQAPAWRGDKYRPRFLNFEIGIDGPSRPRRYPRPSLWRGAGLDANVGPSCRRSFSRRTMRAPAPPALGCRCEEWSGSCQAQAAGGWRRPHRRAFAQAARRRRRRASSLTTRSVGAQARRSRQARRRVTPSAAGIDAASMARRCHLPNKEAWPVFVSPPGRCLRQGGR